MLFFKTEKSNRRAYNENACQQNDILNKKKVVFCKINSYLCLHKTTNIQAHVQCALTPYYDFFFEVTAVVVCNFFVFFVSPLTCYHAYVIIINNNIKM